jgi:hypothetical protein
MTINLLLAGGLGLALGYMLGILITTVANS